MSLHVELHSLMIEKFLLFKPNTSTMPFNANPTASVIMVGCEC